MALVPLRYVPISPFIDESERMQSFLDALGSLLEPELAQDHAKLCIRRLLEFCGRTRPDGLLGTMSARRLAESVGWRLGAPDDFLEAALASGWLEANEEGLRIEGWERHGGRVMAQRESWAQAKRDQRDRTLRRKEQNREAKRRERQRALDQKPVEASDEEKGRRSDTSMIKSRLPADMTTNLADPERTSKALGLTLIVNRQAEETPVASAKSPLGLLQGPVAKRKTKNKTKPLDQEIAFIDCGNPATSSMDAHPAALDALAVSKAIAGRVGLTKLPPRYQPSLDILSGTCPRSLQNAISRAEIICSESGSRINAGLILSCLKTESRKIASPEVSRVGKIWQRGLEHLLLSDADTEL